MRIKIWGCRGSLPTPGASTLRYGGNTTCLEVRTADNRLFVIDAGSGLRRLGQAIHADGGTLEFCLMLTHSHWDHLMGFPFFTPGYFSKYRIRICGGPGAQQSLRTSLGHQMEPPYFPVDLRAMKADFCFDCHAPGEQCHPTVGVHAVPLSHPNGGYGYEFVEDGKRFLFLTDNELGLQHEGGLTRDEYVEVCKGVDILLHDAQYTDEEYEQRTRGWGHSTYREAVDLAIEAGVKRLGLFHHDPDRRDEDLDRILEWCQEHVLAQGSDLDCFVAAEGKELEI